MKLTKLVALGAAALLACASAAAQNIATLPNAATLTGAEKVTAAQGTGCPTKVQPCAIVAVTPAQIGTYLAPTFQSRDADLDIIAALTTQAFGRSLLIQNDAGSTRSYLGLAAVASSGLDTALLGTAWTTYTPTLACASGVLTTASASGRYRRIGKTVFVQLRVAVNTNGSCAGGLIGGLPFPVVSTGNGSDIWTLLGHESGPSGSRMIQGLAVQNTSTATMTIYNGAVPVADNSNYSLSGSYEAQ